MSDKKSNKFKAYALASSFVFEVLLIIVFGFFIGRMADRWMDSNNIFTVVFLIAGALYSVYHLIHTASKMEDHNGTK
jgi:F0F1-type ATP synthase assembly protein I